MSRESILAEVLHERECQLALCFDESDHTENDWVAVACRHLGLASHDSTPQGVCLAGDDARSLAPPDPVRFRRQMVRLATIALAAVEAVDRRDARLQPAAPSVSPDGPLDWFRRQGREMALLYGQTVLLVEGRSPSTADGGHAGLSLVLESAANTWEVANATERYEP